MLTTETREISGRHFQVTQLPGRESLRMFTRLTRLFGPALGAVAKDEAQIASLLETDVAGLGGAIARLCEELDPDDILSIAGAFAKHSKVALEGTTDSFVELNDAIFDVTFQGRMDMLMGWIVFALEVNYSSFLDASPLRRLRDAKAQTGSQSPSAESPST